MTLSGFLCNVMNDNPANESNYQLEITLRSPADNVLLLVKTYLFWVDSTQKRFGCGLKCDITLSNVLCLLQGLFSVNW